MKAQRSDKLISVRVATEAKAKFLALAQAYGLTESGLLKTLIGRAIEPVALPSIDAAHQVRDEARADRLYVRLYRDDRQLLAERAAARCMPSATYLAVLARSHLRQLPPLPEPERRALERCVAELATIGRNINQVARVANQNGVVSSISRADLALFLKTTTAAVLSFKATLKANKQSWESGYETTDR